MSMKEAKIWCPECGQFLIYCPELVHTLDHRPVFKCANERCENFGEYLVLGNEDNFGKGVERK